MLREQKQIPGDPNVRHQRWGLVRGLAVSAPFVVAVWAVCETLVPPLAGLDDPAARLGFGVKCCCVAVMLCFLPGIEAVAHKRFIPAAFDPQSVVAARRAKVDMRYLQHTLEQLLLFVPGVLGLAAYGRDGAGMRGVLAATVVWILSRALFRMGYHGGARLRGAGLIGMVQSVLVLFYVCGRFGYDLAGLPGAVIPIALTFALEGYIILRARS
jgi:hypothetical protein